MNRRQEGLKDEGVGGVEYPFARWRLGSVVMTWLMTTQMYRLNTCHHRVQRRFSYLYPVSFLFWSFLLLLFKASVVLAVLVVLVVLTYCTYFAVLAITSSLRSPSIAEVLPPRLHLTPSLLTTISTYSANSLSTKSISLVGTLFKDVRYH